ncbi:MAG: phosphatidylglycerophosphatase A [Thermodesulfovibrio sp.]|nr:phosphatidylglycerophosphatase A [Thermodesulfovibrio sp.]
MQRLRSAIKLSRGSLILKHIATLGPVGYLPLAPGTWGSAAGALCILLVPLSTAMQLLLVLTCFAIGVVASGAAEKVTGEQDSGHIIIDEFVGMLVSVLFLPQSLGWVLAAFILFRMLDILKPFPIRQVESSLKGGIGVMTDDVLAGIGANLILQLWKMLS